MYDLVKVRKIRFNSKAIHLACADKPKGLYMKDFFVDLARTAGQENPIFSINAGLGVYSIDCEVIRLAATVATAATHMKRTSNLERI